MTGEGGVGGGGAQLRKFPTTKIQTTAFHFLSADLTKKSRRGRWRWGGVGWGGMRGHQLLLVGTTYITAENVHSSKRPQKSGLLSWRMHTAKRRSHPNCLGYEGTWSGWDPEYWRLAGWLAGVGPLTETAHLRVTRVIQTLWPRRQHLHLLCTVFVDGRQRHEWTRQTFSDVTWFPVHMFCYLSSITLLNSHDLQKIKRQKHQVSGR